MNMKQINSNRLGANNVSVKQSRLYQQTISTPEIVREELR